MGGGKARIAVDVGGTFTDLTLANPESGRLTSIKRLTTPGDPARGVFSGLRVLLEQADEDPAQVSELIHGSTTGTNALIQRSGCKVGLLTTEGFRDVLEIGRIMRPQEGLYDFSVDLPPPLVPRYLRLEARERVDSHGSIIVPLDRDSVASAANLFAREGVEAVAVCFLFSFLNAKHEEEAGEILRQLLPDIPITLSSRICPEFREYERSSTAVINAYITPVTTGYLNGLEQGIAERLPAARLSIMQANGGSTAVAVAQEKAVTTVNSGPAGGVVAAAYYGRRHDRLRLVSVDMGGTSFDIGLVEDGRSQVTTEGSFQDLPVRVPIIDLHIIGAGGGSIAWLDPGGALNVGPVSAGAEPGPACYGYGGSEPTVTDANLVLGRLNPDYFNAGIMDLDFSAAETAVGTLATAMGLTIEETALGIIKVVNANMVKGIATVTVQRGIDVRAFSLVCFGGAGGVHAVDLAEQLGMAEVMIPPLPGTFSALGLLVTDTRHDYVESFSNASMDGASAEEIERTFLQLERQAIEDLFEEGFDNETIRLVRSADIKVSGQTYELAIPAPRPVDEAGLAELAKAFAKLYRERYAYFYDDEQLVIVNLRLSAFGVSPPMDLPVDATSANNNPIAAHKAFREIYFDRLGWVRSPVFERARLRPGMQVHGPALIEEPTSVSLVPPEATAHVLTDSGLLVPLEER